MSPLLLFKKLCLGSRLDTDKMRLHLGFFFEKCISVAVVAFLSGFRTLFTGLTNFFFQQNFN